MALTPLDLHNEYRKLPVTLDDASQVTVDIHEYQLKCSNNGDALIEKQSLIGKNKAEAKKNKTGQTMVDTVDAMTKKADIAVCYMGKGSVENLKLTLRLVARYGLEKKFTDLQGYANKNLGLD